MKKNNRLLKKVLALLLVFILANSFVIPAYAAEQSPNETQTVSWYDSIPEMLAAGEYEEGVVVVGIDMSKVSKTGDAASALEDDKLQDATNEIMNVDEGSVQAEAKADTISISVISRPDMTTAQLLEQLASDESVVFAEPNYIVSEEAEEEPDGYDDVDSDDADARGPFPAADATFLQWSSSADSSFSACGENGNASINVPGWPDGSNMDHEIIVAVIDYPVDFSNPDLEDRAYTFSPELQAELGCDVHGFNATWESEDGKLEPFATEMDLGDHGTHVAGIIGASWDGKGINGVGSNIRIISVQNSNENGKTSLVNALRAMNFVKEAKQKGVDIRLTNNSWGLLQNSKALDAAVTELGENGVLSLFAAGNNGKDLNSFQQLSATLADNPYAIIVANSDVSGQLANSSNYGKGIVTLAAPGVDIISCIKEYRYIPALASENTFYEGFENDTTGLKIYQIDPETGEKVNDGVIVNGDEYMGFEGKKVMKVPVNHSYAYAEYEYQEPICFFRMDFSDVEGIDLNTDELIGIEYGGSDEIGITDISGYDGWFFGLYSHRDSWNLCTAPLNEMDLEAEGGPYLTIAMEANNVDEVYFDSIGIGSEKHPYGFKSGTSMACPAVTGGAAVIASRHYDELAAGDADAAKKLAGYIRSSVRPLPALTDKVSTGGVFDLSVDTQASGASDTPTQDMAPDITDIAVSGTEVTLTGTGFGTTDGSAEVRKYIVGTESELVGSEVSAWSDTSVTLSLDENFEGIIEVSLKAANGKTDKMIRFINKSSNLFETDLSITTDVGDVFAFDAPDGADPKTVRMGESESSGIMLSLDGKIFYMPFVSEVEKDPAYRTVWCYDTALDQWTNENIPAFPAWISDASGTVYDGKLYVKGTLIECEENRNIPYYKDLDWDEVPVNVIYSYIPGEDSWKECSSEGVTAQMTLFSTDTGLMMAGCMPWTDWEDYSGADRYEFWKYDPGTGLGESVGTLPSWIDNPLVVYAFGHVCLCREDGLCLYVMGDDLDGENALEIETPIVDKNLDPDIIPNSEPTLFTLAGDENRLILIFSDRYEGSGDAFILTEGESAFAPYEKRVSDAALFGPSASILDGKLYVLSSSVYEPEKRLFRSTALDEQFTIVYDLNGGSFDGSTENITEEYVKGSNISIHEAPVREGYRFTYWKGSEYHPGDKYTVTEDHTFVAQWEKTESAVLTGDTNHPAFWIILAILSMLAIAVMAAIAVRHGENL